jgi:NADPH2:quinone reductase
MARTAIIEAPGGPEQFRIVDRDVATPGPGEIRIRHEACGLNFIDVYQRTGLYPLKCRMRWAWRPLASSRPWARG